MKWPWQRRVENRASYSESVAQGIFAQASGLSPDPSSIGALEVAAGLWSRAFSSARPDPDLKFLSPVMLAAVGRNLVRNGESLWVIDVSRDGFISLHEVASYDVAGGYDSASWVYRANLSGPSGSETRLVPSASMLHFRYGTRPERPWEGVSPGSFGATATRLLGALETRLGQESNARVGHLLPTPSDGGDGGEGDPLADLKTDLANMAGNTALVETTAAGWGDRGGAPQADWRPQRIGANPPAPLVALMDASRSAVLAQLGVPVALGTGSEGAAMREGWRQFLFSTISPLSRTLEHELSGKLDQKIRLDFAQLFSSDLTGRARAFSQMVSGGMDPGKAAGLAGLMDAN